MKTWAHGRINLIIIICISFISCQVDKKECQSADIEQYTYQLKNKVLLTQIQNYIDFYKVSKETKRVVHINVFQVTDTTVFELNYAKSAFQLISTPSTIFIRMNGELIALSYFYFQDIYLPDNDAWHFLKEIFPEEYDYYIKNNDYPLPSSLGKDHIWLLKFLVVSLDDYSVFPEIGDIWLFYATKFSERTIHISKCGWSRNIENPINMNSIFFPKPLTTNTSESELLVLDAITLSNLNNELFNDITTLRNKKNQDKFNSLFLTVNSLKEQTKLILVIMIFIVISLLGIIIILIKKL